MAEQDSLPKTGKSTDWFSYADKKRQEFKDHHSAMNIHGQLKYQAPLVDDYSKHLAQHETDARKMGMDLLKKEKDEEHATNMAKLKKAQERTAPEPEATVSPKEAKKPVRKASRKTSRAKSR